MKFNKLPQYRIEIYQKMTPQQRIEEAIQLSDLTYEVMKDGIRNQHPNLDEEAIQKLVLERMKICRKNNY